MHDKSIIISSYLAFEAHKYSIHQLNHIDAVIFCLPELHTNVTLAKIDDLTFNNQNIVIYDIVDTNIGLFNQNFHERRNIYKEYDFITEK